MIAIVAAAVLSLAPCRYGDLAAQCGSMAVPEVRKAAHSRTIDVHFVLVRATSATPKEPIFPIAGGPGQSAIETFRGPLVNDQFFGPLHRDHDLVFVDQRGTGSSHALACQLFPTDASTYRYLFPPGMLRACRARLARSSDLNAYGSDAAADDFDDLRAALGYGKILLFGGSYGTTEELVYLRRHGQSVRAALMESVSPPWMLLPLPFAKGAQHALEDLERSCAHDAACSSRFPHFASEFDALAVQAKKGIAVNGGTISFEVFADRMRQSMYASEIAAYLPLIVHRAASGDTTPLAKLVAQISHSIPGSLAMGMNSSVDCSEALAFVTDAQAQAAGTGTFMEDSRYKAQRDACAIWHVKPVARSFLNPVLSNVPVLMVSGADDPATPPQFARQALRYLANGRQVIVPNAGHEFGSTCLAQLEVRFLETASTQDLKTGCLRAAARPPFATTLKGLF